MLPEKRAGYSRLQLIDDSKNEAADKAAEKKAVETERKRAAYRIDLRSYVDRRQTMDRRTAIRFEDDRRHYIRRLEDRAWRLT